MEAKYPRRELNSGPLVSETSALSAELRGLKLVVGMTRFERATLCSQSRCATKLRHIPFRVVEADAGLVPAEGIEPTHPKERIYSPPRLASAPCRHGDLGRVRTADTLGVNQVLFQLSYETETVLNAPRAPVTGLEPATSALTGRRANHLLYTGMRGIAPRGRPGWI